jgi:DNA-directed RNA polymerase subunit F
MNYKVLKEEFVTKAEIKEILSQRKDLELEQKLSKEHVGAFKKLKLDKVLKLKEDLKALGNPKLNDELIVKIIDIFPSNIDELKVVLQMSLIPFSDDEIQKVFECLKSYL